MSTMYEGTIPMSEKEARAISRLAEKEKIVGLTRAGPGETGAVQVETEAGVYHVSAAGRVKQVQA